MFAPEVSERGLPAVWLTPLLSEASVIAGLARATRPTLLVGGTADAAWRVGAIPENLCSRLLSYPESTTASRWPAIPSRRMNALRQVTESVIHLAAQISKHAT